MFIDRIVPAPGRNRPRPIGRGTAGAMVVRAATALVGGYAAAAVLATLIARLLPIDRAEATAWGMVTSFLVYAVIGLWCFHEVQLARVAGAVWGVALIGGGAAWLLGIRP